MMKLLKTATFGPDLCKERSQYGPNPKQKDSSAEVTKADQKLSKTFYFIKIYVLCDVFLLKRLTSSHNRFVLKHTYLIFMHFKFHLKNKAGMFIFEYLK